MEILTPAISLCKRALKKNKVYELQSDNSMNTEKFLQAFCRLRAHILSGTIAAAVDDHVFFAKGFGIPIQYK
jgi:riboflavin synthase alpha subunit